MKIKKYNVKDMQEALKLIRQDLGPDAVIVSSYNVPGKGLIGFFGNRKMEVTAVLDEVKLPEINQTPALPEEPPAVSLLANETIGLMRTQAPYTESGNRSVFNELSTGSLAYKPNALPETEFKPLIKEIELARNRLAGEAKGLDEMAENLPGSTEARDNYNRWFDTLVNLDIHESVARDLLDQVLTGALENCEDDDIIKISLINKMTDIIRETYSKENNTRFITFIGPPGVGKTTTLAKLATRMKLLDKKQVALITIYAYRYGTADQLKVYGGAIDVPVEVVMTPAELRQAVARHGDKDYILIDTVGRSAKNAAQVLEIKGFLEAINGPQEVFLVLSASTKDRDIFRAINDFQIAHFTGLIFSKTDETETLGTMLNVICKFGLPVVYYTNGQNIPDDIEKVQPKKLAKLIFRSVDGYEDSV